MAQQNLIFDRVSDIAPRMIDFEYVYFQSNALVALFLSK